MSRVRCSTCSCIAFARIYIAQTSTLQYSVISKNSRRKRPPGFAISALTAIATICSFILPESNPVNEAIQVVGAPDAAMLLSLLFSIWSMGFARKKTVSEISTSITESVKQIAMMLLIIGGGGAFKQVLVDGGISDYVSSLFANLNMSPLIAAWLVAAVLRVCLGSATVASLTAAGLVAPMLAMSSVNPALMVLAVGTGSVIADHVNDAGFWMIKEYFGLSLKETFLSWTTATTVMSVTGLVSVLGLSLFI